MEGHSGAWRGRLLHSELGVMSVHVNAGCGWCIGKGVCGWCIGKGVWGLCIVKGVWVAL